MRNAFAAMLAALMLITGCSTAVEKRSYLLSLISWCAQVNERLADVVPSVEAGRTAEELRELVDKARSEPPPDEDRETLRQLLDSFERTADRFSAAQQARDRGDDDAAAAQQTAAVEHFQETNAVATEYGMPPLDTCDEVMNSESPSPQPAPSTSAAPTPEPMSEDPTQSETAGWRPLDDARLARQQVAAAGVGGLIYVAGGVREQTGSRKVEALDPTVNQWRSIPDLLIPLHGAMAVNYRDELVVLGGWRPQGNNLNAVVSDRVFALRSDEWVELARLRRPRAAGAAAVVDDEIIVVGGQADNQLIAETEVYDGDANEWRDGAAIPTSRDHLAAASDDRYVYAVGGRNVTAASNVGVLERYDPAADDWETLASMTTARGSIDADIVDGRLVVVGGESPTAVLDDVEAYDIASDIWHEFPSLPRPLHGTGVVAVGSVLYTLNGAEGTSHTGSSAAVNVLTPPPRPLQPTRWRNLDAAPLARQQVALTDVGGVIWVVGGLEDTTVATPEVQGLDPSTGRWRSTEDLPEPLHHAMAVDYNGTLVVIGGWIARGTNPTAETSNKVYALRSGTWEELPPLAHARAAGAAAVVDDKIIVVGGQADNQLVPQTEIYDGETGEWRAGAAIPTPREHLAVGTHDGHVYAVGGRALGPDDNFAVLERYDVDADQWETMTSMPTARGSIDAAVIADRLVVVGGETASGVLDAVEMYDFASNAWSAAQPVPTPRHGAGVAAVDSSLYVINGAETTSHMESSTAVEVLDFE